MSWRIQRTPEVNQYALEALVSRVAAALAMLFPGSKCRLEVDKREPFGYPQYRITLQTVHDGMPGRQYSSEYLLPVEVLAYEGDKFFEHLMRDLPVQHIRGVTEYAVKEAHARRFG